MFEPSVTVVNRVRDADGKPVPWSGLFGGDRITITDRATLPVGVARVLVHQSMYHLEPDTWAGDYRLGCAELGLTEDPITVEESQPIELIRREMLGPDRQFGAAIVVKTRTGLKERTLQPVKTSWRPPRRPVMADNPGQSDGAFPGTYERP